MGLDMYLHKRTYVKRWDFMPGRNQFDVTVRRGGEPFEAIKPERIKYIIEEVGYWRKANAIHAWFVKNVQNGVDDCGEYFVMRSQLEELLTLVNDVLENGGAVDKLPTEGGFFFGSIRYDEGYHEDLIKTQEILTPLLAEEDEEYFYHSSW